jgi:hypothetical protein
MFHDLVDELKPQEEEFFDDLDMDDVYIEEPEEEDDEFDDEFEDGDIDRPGDILYYQCNCGQLKSDTPSNRICEFCSTTIATPFYNPEVLDTDKKEAAAEKLKALDEKLKKGMNDDDEKMSVVKEKLDILNASGEAIEYYTCKCGNSSSKCKDTFTRCGICDTLVTTPHMVPIQPEYWNLGERILGKPIKIDCYRCKCNNVTYAYKSTSGWKCDKCGSPANIPVYAYEEG